MDGSGSSCGDGIPLEPEGLQVNKSIDADRMGSFLSKK